MCPPAKGPQQARLWLVGSPLLAYWGWVQPDGIPQRFLAPENQLI